MSSYLNIYVVPKEEGTKPMRLMCFRGSHELYSAISDNISVAYAGEKEIYTDLTESVLNEILSDLKTDINKAEKRLREYQKYALNNPDLISEILSSKEYIEELYKSVNFIEILQTIVFDCNSGFNVFEKVCCNID